MNYLLSFFSVIIAALIAMFGFNSFNNHQTWNYWDDSPWTSTPFERYEGERYLAEELLGTWLWESSHSWVMEFFEDGSGHDDDNHFEWFVRSDGVLVWEFSNWSEEWTYEIIDNHIIITSEWGSSFLYFREGTEPPVQSWTNFERYEGYRGFDEALVGVWPWEDSPTWVIAFDADGFGHESGDPFEWFIAENGELVLEFSGWSDRFTYEVIGDILMLDHWRHFREGTRPVRGWDENLIGRWVGGMSEWGFVLGLNFFSGGWGEEIWLNPSTSFDWYTENDAVILFSHSDERVEYKIEDGILFLEYEGELIEFHKQGQNPDIAGIWRWEENTEWTYNLLISGRGMRGTTSSSSKLQWITAGDYIIFWPFAHNEEVWHFSIENNILTLTSALDDSVYFRYIR